MRDRFLEVQWRQICAVADVLVAPSLVAALKRAEAAGVLKHRGRRYVIDRKRSPKYYRKQRKARRK